MKLVILLVALVFLTACTPDAVELETAVNPTEEAALSPASSFAPNAAAMSWSSTPDDIILQYDISGGLMGGGPGTRLPLWTLYGDGLVVWTEEGSPTPGFTGQVWTGHLDEAEIQDLVFFAQQEGFFDLDMDYKAPRFIPAATDESPQLDLEQNVEGSLDQSTGIIILNLLTQQHRVQVYPVEWTESPQAYRALRERILTVRPLDASPFIPATFQLSAEPLSVEAAVLPPMWPFAAIILSDAVNTPHQLNADQGNEVAEFLATQGAITIEMDQPYRLYLLADPPRKP